MSRFKVTITSEGDTPTTICEEDLSRVPPQERAERELTAAYHKAFLKIPPTGSGDPVYSDLREYPQFRTAVLEMAAALEKHTGATPFRMQWEIEDILRWFSPLTYAEDTEARAARTSFKKALTSLRPGLQVSAGRIHSLEELRRALDSDKE